MSVSEDVKSILGAVFQSDSLVASLDESSALLGAIPEFDSMAVVAIITALEENYGFSVDDDEIDAEVFETVGSLVRFVERKLA